jgi:hypothetical protein
VSLHAHADWLQPKAVWHATDPFLSMPMDAPGPGDE